MDRSRNRSTGDGKIIHELYYDTWVVILLDEVDRWYLDLAETDPATADLVTAAIDLLAESGPALGRPAVDSITGSQVHNLRELRASTIRVLFAFDPQRRAVLLVAGDKAGSWASWYTTNVPVAERRYAAWLAGEYDYERH